MKIIILNTFNNLKEYLYFNFSQIDIIMNE